LNSKQVEYLIVGGHAVAFHGYPRYTGDIDFFIRPSPENAQRIIAVLTDFGFRRDLSAQDFETPGRIIQLGRPPNRIDLLTAISGVDFDEAWASRVQSKMDGLAVAFIGKDALLKNKHASGRTKDLADVEQLEEP
jgi:hypothetical protein